jgi:hypothetical protein
MLDARLLDEVLGRITAVLPPGLERLQDDTARNLRAAVSSALERMSLVTRQEFDVQVAVLARTRAALERLEGRVAELEAALATRDDDVQEPG